jgi:hypothetical protein
MKIILWQLLVILNVSASEFEGCGVYQLKGILRAKNNSFDKVVYVVNEGTKSQLIFELKKPETLSALFPLLNKPSSFIGKIIVPMNGTNGIVEDATKISFRLPNPLMPNDTGIEKQSSINCKF